jgi:septum site-determining protein MinD
MCFLIARYYYPMQRVFGVMSGKGGVGKTVTTINIAAALHGFGHDTTIVDADIGSANLTVHLGLPDAEHSLQDVLEERVDLYRAIRVVPHGLKIIPASLSLDKSMVEMSGLKGVLRSKELGGTALIDAPPGYGREIFHIMEACDEIIVVTNPDVPSITDAVKVIEVSKRAGKEVRGIVINRVERGSSEVLVAEIESLCSLPVLGVIPEDKRVKKSVFDRAPLVFHSPHSKAAIQYKHLAAGLVGEEYSPPAFASLRRLLG